MSAETELVLVWATGSDGDLQWAGHELLKSGAVTKVDRIDISQIIKNDTKPKVKSTGMAFMFLTTRGNVETVFGRLRSVDGIAAHAVPVLAAL